MSYILSYIFFAVIGVVFGCLALACILILCITCIWHRKMDARYRMLKRWSFHPPKDPEKVVIREDRNTILFFARPTSIQFPTYPACKVVDHDNTTATTDPNKSTNLQVVPDLVINLSEDRSESEEAEVFIRSDNKNDGGNTIKRQAFYRKPTGRFIKPKLSVVPEDDDDDDDDDDNSDNDQSDTLNASARSSVIIHNDVDIDLDQDYIESKFKNDVQNMFKV